MRKVNGASRQLLVGQFMVESYVLIFLSFILSLVIVVLFLPFYPKFFGNEISFHFMLDWRNVAGLIGLFLGVGLIAGGYPAFYLSSLQPLNILKSSFGSLSNKGQWNVLYSDSGRGDHSETTYFYQNQ